MTYVVITVYRDMFWNTNTTVSFYYWRLFYCIQSFASASFSIQPQLLFVLLQFEVGSDKNTLELSNEVLLSETKRNHVNTKATRVYSFLKNTNTYTMFTSYRIAVRSVTNCISDRVFVHTWNEYLSTLFISDSSWDATLF